jgi:repressor LexA
MGWKTSKDLQWVPLKEEYKVPIIGSVRCGPGGPAYECIDEYISVDESFGRPEEIRGFRAEGDSMSGDGINDGDVCLVHLQDDVEDGQIAVVVLCNSYEPEGMIKRIRRDRGMVILQSSNPAYPPRIITGEETNAVHIIGRVVEVRHRY